MSKKFDGAAYVAGWDAKIIPIMVATIVVSLFLVVLLNIKSRPSCLRHEYIFCGTTEVLETEHAGGHAAGGAEGHEAAPAHGAENPH